MQFTAGAVGGTLLSPIPWKLTDDVAIWSQNWSWRPSPPKGEITMAPTICTLCDGGCGIRAHLVDKKRAILLDGNPNHPVNGGGICALGASGLQFLYAPYRVAQPMKQTKKRGDPKGFQPVSWADALKDLGGRLSKLRTDGKAQAVACISGQRQSSMDDMWRQFFKAYGSPNFFKMPSQTDNAQIAAQLTLGQDSPFAYGLENASAIFSFGANLLEGWGAPGRIQAALLGLLPPGAKGTAKVVQIESRCSLTAAKADLWVPVNPGSEAAIALGIAHVLVKENLYDAEFVRSQVFGFEDWTDAQGKTRQGFKNYVLSKECSPEEVSKSTGLEVGRIRELAKEFASQKNAVAVWGGSQSGTPGNLYHELSYQALNVLKGNLKPGGLVSVVPPVPIGAVPKVEPDDLAKRSLQDSFVDKTLGRKAPAPESSLYAFLDGVSKGSAYPVSILMVHECNPAYSLPENPIFQKAAEKVELVVSFSSYMDETAVQADLILPNHMALERFDDVQGIVGVPYAYYAVAAPVLKPLKDTRHTGDVVIELGKAVGGPVPGALPWKSYEEFLKERVKGLAAAGKGTLADRPGVEPWKLQPGDAVKTNFKDAADLWKKLTGGSCWYDAPVDPLEGSKTASGKVELACAGLRAMGVSSGEDRLYLPHYSPLKPSGDEKEYPLWLVSHETSSITHGYLANPPFMTKGIFDFVLKGNDLFVGINPQTAKSIGMGQAERAVLKTPQGEAVVLVHLTAAVRPGVVSIVHGLGHKAYDQYIQGKGVNANNLVQVQMDPVTGLGTVWATRAQLRRA